MITYEELRKTYKKIIAWGGGIGFSQLYKGDKKDIAYVVDSNEKLWGSVVSATDILICSPQGVRGKIARYGYCNNFSVEIANISKCA